jgi:hypothetical protein
MHCRSYRDNLNDDRLGKDPDESCEEPEGTDDDESDEDNE